MTVGVHGKKRSRERHKVIQNTLSFFDPVNNQRQRPCVALWKFHTSSLSHKQKGTFEKLWMCEAFSSKLGRVQTQTPRKNLKQTGRREKNHRWNGANRCHFVCLYCGHDITSFWNDVQKCNRTENGSDEVELSHRLAGMKTTQYKNKNNPEKKKKKIQIKQTLLSASVLLSFLKWE